MCFGEFLPLKTLFDAWHKEIENDALFLENSTELLYCLKPSLVFTEGIFKGSRFLSLKKFQKLS